VNIEGYENIIMLNINHWGGGVNGLWKPNNKLNFVKDSHSDGFLEVLGLTDIVHMGQVQVGLDEPFQVGQGHVMVLKSKVDNKIVPLQIDG
jgi:diacylglycerol kinase (ATP)